MKGIRRLSTVLACILLIGTLNCYKIQAVTENRLIFSTSAQMIGYYIGYLGSVRNYASGNTLYSTANIPSGTVNVSENITYYTVKTPAGIWGL